MSDADDLGLDYRRIEYDSPPLRRSDLDPDPVVQVRRWLAEWAASGLVEPNSMVLATASPDGRPSARWVLLREITDDGGFVFFTNGASRKGRDLEANPLASLCFGWLGQHHQVRVEGPVTRIPEADSDAYFASRPRGSQLAAWASERQSHPIGSRSELEARYAEAEARFAGEVPRPPTWGGYCVQAVEVEVWQGRANRLHDRFLYRRSDGGWALQRLTP